MYKKSTAALIASAILSVSAQTGPYAGQQERAIKALPDKEAAELLAGEGMGLAKAAELNGYPGPAHVLEHAQALLLSDEQRRASKALFDKHKARARSIGAQLVVAEKALDQAFASRRIDNAALSPLTAHIGQLQGRLRAEHLQTHLEQTVLLNEDQIRRYAGLRGYAGSTPSGHGKHH